jgi:hypothetical protein
MTNRQTWMEWIFRTLREAAWAPLSVFFLYRLALALQLFRLYPPLDIPTHFLGGVAITYFCRVAIQHSQKLVGEIPFSIQVIFAFTCAGTTAIFWELYEYVFDFFFQTHMVRGVTDTSVDLVVGLSGALAWSVLYRQR